jgi:hypothetical protein
MTRRRMLIAGGLVAVAVMSLLLWIFFFASPFTFRSDCRQTGPNAWVCDTPFSGPVPDHLDHDWVRAETP